MVCQNGNHTRVGFRVPLMPETPVKVKLCCGRLSDMNEGHVRHSLRYVLSVYQ